MNEQGTKKSKVYTLSVIQSMFIYLKPRLDNEPDNEDSETSRMRFLSSRTSWSNTGGAVQGNRFLWLDYTTSNRVNNGE